MSEFDIVPHGQDDHIEHEATEECPCGPQVIPVERDDGTIGWVYAHHSLDGREKDPENASRRQEMIERAAAALRAG